MEGGDLVEIRDLHKSFARSEGEVKVLRGIDLSIKRGEAVSMVGESGAGKSTLLHILGALEPPTSGRVLVDGLDLWGLSSKDLSRFRNSRFGFVFQFHHLLPEFTALENVMMPALISRMGARDAAEQARGVLDELGMSRRLTHKVGELSGGEQQRVAIARAVIMKPDMILADEPTGNLDVTTGRTVEELLLRLNKDRGITLFVVTHSERLAGRMDRMVRLMDGRVV